MKISLISLSTFLLGTIFGGMIMAHACRNAIHNIDVETTARKAVKDISAAYEGALDKNGFYEKLRESFEECVKENARLKRRPFNSNSKIGQK